MEDRERLSRWLDGELPDGERRALEERLAHEPALAAEAEALRALIGAAEALPREIEPAHDLWPGIERRLATEAPARSSSAWSAGKWLRAAAVAAVVFGGGVLLGRLSPRDSGAPIATAPPDSARTDAAVVHDAIPTEEEWAATSAELYRALEASPGRLDPATEEAVRRNLEIIDQAVHEIRAALGQDPSNPRLQKLLTAEYRKRGTILRRAAALNVLPLRIGFESST